MSILGQFESRVGRTPKLLCLLYLVCMVLWSILSRFGSQSLLQKETEAKHVKLLSEDDRLSVAVSRDLSFTVVKSQVLF